MRGRSRGPALRQAVDHVGYRRDEAPVNRGIGDLSPDAPLLTPREVALLCRVTTKTARRWPIWLALGPRTLRTTRARLEAFLTARQENVA